MRSPTFVMRGWTWAALALFVRRCAARRGLAAAVVGGLALGCANAPEIAVELRTDLVAGVEFDAVRTSLDGLDAPRRAARLGEDFVRSLRVAEFPSLAPGLHAVTLDVLDGRTVVLSRRVTVRLEGSLIVSVVATRDCRGVVCPTSDAPGATECLGGACVEPSCSAEDRASCPMAECRTNDGCPRSAPCVVPLCAAGVCFEAVDDGTCAPTEICVPGRGCIARPPEAGDAAVGPDAPGAADAGDDAGRDAGDDGGGPVDAGRDAGDASDAGGVIDAGRDAGPDAGPDAGFDAGFDAGTRCGSEGLACCAGSACGAGTVCVGGTCRRCGGLGQPCCAGSACGAGVCAGGACVACGERGQP